MSSAVPKASTQSTLKALRVAAKLSRRALGDLIGCSDRTIARYEADYHALPVPKAAALALHIERRLGVTVDPTWLYLPAATVWRAEVREAAKEVSRKEVIRQLAGLPLFSRAAS